ncbi:MAG: hypothetical protein GC159_01195 [Phycisphaera sp.]|nr:hypothetical protein [Phycisphaera sp.]
MTNPQYEFSTQAVKVTPLVEFLHKRRQSVCGPRTLSQAYAEFWMKVMSTSLTLSDREHKVIQKMAPLRVDWTVAYAWWKDHDSSAA